MRINYLINIFSVMIVVLAIISVWLTIAHTSEYDPEDDFETPIEIYDTTGYNNISIDFIWNLSVRTSAFSTDGEYLFYMPFDESYQSNFTIWKYDLKNQTKTIIFTNDVAGKVFGQNEIRLSHDGNVLIFSTYSRAQNKSSIEIIHKNESDWNINIIHRTIFETKNYHLSNLEINPDNSNIIFQSYNKHERSLWLMDLNTKNKTQLIDNSTHFDDPNFSFDGGKIVYVSWEESRFESTIWTMDIDGSNKKNIKKSESLYSNPTFIDQDHYIYESNIASPEFLDGSKSYGRSFNNIWLNNIEDKNEILLLVFASYPVANTNFTRITFFHIDEGISYIENNDGIDSDSDGDFVADIIDGNPTDPDEGYLKKIPDNESQDNNLLIIVVALMFCLFIIMIGINALHRVKQRKKKEHK